MIEMKGNSDNRVSVSNRPIEEYVEKGMKSVFYVRSFDPKMDVVIEKLMVDTKEMAIRTGKPAEVVITQNGGVYRVEANHPISLNEYPLCFWGMLHRMFSAFAREILIEEDTKARYYRAIVSHEYIAQKTRLYVA